jgi:hypothetical protein
MGTAIDQTVDAGGRAKAAPASGGRDSRPASRLTISARFLLGIYAIVPLCFLAMVLDRLFWGGSLFHVLPTSPESFFYFQLAFGTPHIIASAVILAANTDYLRAFWVRLVFFTV